MIKKLPFLILIIFFSCKAQDKIKGSRKVKTEQYNLTSFHSLKLSGDFEIGIMKGTRPMVEIKADDNLHDYIQTEVIDGVLIIKPIKEFQRTKSQEIRIIYADTLKQISIAEKVELESLQDLFLGDFELETRDNAEAFLTLTANNFNLIHGGDAKAELNITAREVYYQLNQGSKVEALVSSPSLKVDIYEKASARIDGDIDAFELRADQSAKFDGENLEAINVKVLTNGDAKCKVNATKTLEIRANGKSEIEIYNDPKIKLIEFNNEAVIAKKDFSKGIFK